MLLVVGNEESVFWLLSVLIEGILPGYHTRDMTGVLAEIYSLGKLIQEKKPVLWSHLEYNNVDLSLVVTKWFVCVFVEVLPIETVLRIWDCLFYEGNKIIMRVAVALIFANEENLFMSQDFGSIIECFKTIVQNKAALHCHSFMENVFKLSGPLPRASINQLRKEGEEKALKENEADTKRV
ncbi:Growth hormone-regulated TBC protein 1-A [Armadillidium nasatum]|uniref:Growth hormone-regulated TBC protein 1-A n=1 Tax=Armadillidium nasatum TaxID=96803 RepID=A0A5N5TB04_9CRUS|nr:Growth hormone-regulated TBC protein 1-A [Armadillidium nasatum]